LQSANVEQLAPGWAVPRSFDGLDGHPPFTCSALDEMFALDSEPLEPLELLLDALGFVGSVLDPGTPLVPPLHARRKREVAAEATVTRTH
jgi:hypothetical protein